MNKASKQIDKLLDEAFSIAIAEVERMARQVMKNNPRCKSYCLGMGTSVFYDADGEPVGDWGPLPYPDYLTPLDNFIDKWDKSLCITGTPMRIKGHDGLMEKDW